MQSAHNVELGEMKTPPEDQIETCPCTINAIHTAWNCPTCKGKGWIEKDFEGEKSKESAPILSKIAGFLKLSSF